jgi:hypothetical protein
VCAIGTVRTFWIHAIYINQLDGQERGHQVKCMGEFYRAADRTTVWLGNEAEYTALAFEDMLEREATKEQRNLWETGGALLEKEESLLGKLSISKEELVIILEKENKFLQKFQSNTVIASQGFEELERRRKQLEQRCEEPERQCKELEEEILHMNKEDQRLEQVVGVCEAILREISEEVKRGGSKHVRASLIANSRLMELTHRLQVETPLRFLWQRSSISARDYLDPASEIGDLRST